MRLLPSALALMMIPATLAAAPRRAWDFAIYSHVRRNPAERGAPASSQPLVADPAVLAQALATVRFVAAGKELPLFHKDELEPLSKALSEALALAGPADDLELLSSHKRDKGFFGEYLGVTARVFVEDGKFNLIVHDTRLDWVYAFNYDNRMPVFDYGSRTKAGTAVLKAAGAEARRADWLVLPLTAVAEKPVAPIAPVVQPAPPVPAPSAVKPSASVEERLKGLKGFREKNLITEEEYVKQKQELLKEYAQGKKD